MSNPTVPHCANNCKTSGLTQGLNQVISALSHLFLRFTSYHQRLEDYQTVSWEIKFAHPHTRTFARVRYECKKAYIKSLQCAFMQPFFGCVMFDCNFARFGVKKAQFWTFLVTKTTLYAFSIVLSTLP